MLSNKDKMIYAAKELENLIFQIKKSAIAQKTKQKKIDDERREQDLNIEQNFNKRIENLEKELNQKARKELIKKMEEKDLKFEEKLKSLKSETEQKVF